jgi:hypothetical protein
MLTKGEMTMKRLLVAILFTASLAAPAFAGELTTEDFQVKTTEDLIDLCTPPPGNPLQEEAINFCHGFLVGAYHYYAASNEGAGGERLVCLPDPPPARNDVIAMFIKWAKTHPEYMKEKPVDTEFRFLAEKWPCK